MNAFISYSISQHEQYIVSLLAQKLAEAGLTSVTNYNQSDSIDYQAINEIKNCGLFIGLITRFGFSIRSNRVIAEFTQAQSFNRPAIFLIEDSVLVAPPIAGYHNLIRFNRHNVAEAAQEVRNRIAAIQQKATADGAAWLVGGLAIIALLSYLSDKKS